MSARVGVVVSSDDPVTEAGVTSQLRLSPELVVVTSPDQASVGVVACDHAGEPCLAAVRRLARHAHLRVVLVATDLDDAGLLRAVEAGIVGALPRREATSERLAELVRRAAADEGSLPPAILGRLLRQVGRLQRDVLTPRGLGATGFTEREIEILRLVAEGLDTGEIARQLCFSERTVKNALHDVTSRFNLRNRCHAVSFALRTGVI